MQNMISSQEMIMKTLSLVLVLLALQTCLKGAYSYRYQGSTESDYVRGSYVQLENNLWQKVVNKESLYTQNERLFKIFNQHYAFVQQYLDKNYDGDDFNVLQRFYEWNVLETDLINVHKLFETFRQNLEHELESNDKKEGDFNERANLDLIETILDDPLWPINATIEKINLVISGQGLYYKAVAVRCILHYFPSSTYS